MNTKLSKLQKYILSQLTDDCRQGDLLKFFGSPTSPSFKYNSAAASISRALKSLKERGLVRTEPWSLIRKGRSSYRAAYLTDAGRETVKSSVKLRST
jgi:hypothetical protein